ncbi:hypothetical protein ACQ7HM_18035 [Williamsia sp. MIQD14]
MSTTVWTIAATVLYLNFAILLWVAFRNIPTSVGGDVAVQQEAFARALGE